jgi:hypothetical protein
MLATSGSVLVAIDICARSNPTSIFPGPRRSPSHHPLLPCSRGDDLNRAGAFTALLGGKAIGHAPKPQPRRTGHPPRPEPFDCSGRARAPDRLAGDLRSAQRSAADRRADREPPGHEPPGPVDPGHSGLNRRAGERAPTSAVGPAVARPDGRVGGWHTGRSPAMDRLKSPRRSRDGRLRQRTARRGSFKGGSEVRLSIMFWIYPSQAHCQTEAWHE